MDNLDMNNVERKTPVDEQNPDDLFGLEWHRSTVGYEIVSERRSRASLLLTGSSSADEKVRLIRRKGNDEAAYHPRMFPDLHRVFANLDDSEDAIHSFVSKYGFLGVAGPTTQPVKDEPLTEITRARKQLREVLDYLDENAEVVKQLRRSANTQLKQGKVPKFQPGIVQQEAANLFNSWAASYLNQFQVRLTPIQAYRGPSVSFQVRPRTLLSSLWLRAAEEIVTGIMFRRCRVCGRFFPIGEGGRRRDTMTCGSVCRQSKSRENRNSGGAGKKRRSK